MKNNTKLLDVKNLRTAFNVEGKDVTVVNDVSFDLSPGEIVGLVGESGCGKSVTALSLMGLVPDPPGKILGGEIFLEGKDLLKFSESDMEKVRGKEIGMIFQEPMTSLNPVLTIGKQITEILELHQEMNEEEATKEAIELLKLVGLPDPELRINDHPHQLSGGQRQRTALGRALLVDSSVIVLDDALASVDNKTAANILSSIRKEKKRTIVMISHQLSAAAACVRMDVRLDRDRNIFEVSFVGC